MSKKKTLKQNENQQTSTESKAEEEKQQEDRYTASERAADFKKYAELKRDK